MAQLKDTLITGDARVTGNIYGTLKGTADVANQLGNDTIGGTTTPIYLNNGVPTSLGYTLAKSVPSDAVFTDNDTKNTAGSTDTSSKIFLVGTTSQTASAQTYSHDTAYVGTDGCLYSGGAQVLTAHQSLANYVPTSRTINSKALSGNISLTASDVGASPSSHTHETSIATSTGTNQITLAASTKYSLNAGGSSYVFTTPPNTTYGVATTSANGLMSSTDKSKLDGIAAQATKVTINLISGTEYKLTIA